LNFFADQKIFRKEFGGKNVWVLCTTCPSFLARVSLFVTVEQLQFLAAPFLESETKTKLIYSRRLKMGAEKTESLDSAAEGNQHICYAIRVFDYCLFL